MWVENTEPETHPTDELSDPEGTNGETVEFTDNWTANVTTEVGESMVEHYSHIEEVEDEETDVTYEYDKT
jgi:hypothetical protein